MQLQKNKYSTFGCINRTVACKKEEVISFFFLVLVRAQLGVVCAVLGSVFSERGKENVEILKDDKRD